MLEIVKLVLIGEATMLISYFGFLMIPEGLAVPYGVSERTVYHRIITYRR